MTAAELPGISWRRGTSSESCRVKSCYGKFTHFCNSPYLLSDVPVAPASNTSPALKLDDMGWGYSLVQIFRKKERKKEFPHPVTANTANFSADPIVNF